MSHTPGPWNLERDCNGVPEFVFGGDTCVCDFGIEAPKPEDARLIAAAPELLEVCEALLALNNTLVVELSESDWLKYRREAERKAKAALAKARGVEVEGE